MSVHPSPMAKLDLALCRSCDAQIIWVRSEMGRPMPIDPQPCDDGNIVIEGGVGHVVGKQKPRYPGGPIRYRSHFVTCPDARQWRGT